MREERPCIRYARVYLITHIQIQNQAQVTCHIFSRENFQRIEPEALKKFILCPAVDQSEDMLFLRQLS
jgi:hypothetical protein